MNTERPHRKHGLQLPFNTYQVSSWIIFLGEAALSYLVFIPPLETIDKVKFPTFENLSNLR